MTNPVRLPLVLLNDVSRSMDAVEYSGTFADDRDTEAIRIVNDGHTLTTRIRDIEFSGTDFDGLEPAAEQTTLASTLFSLHLGSLGSCDISWTMPVLLSVAAGRIHAPLHVRLHLGGRTETLALELHTPSGPIRSSGRSGWFEDELLDLVRQLPADVRLIACITCQFSDYNPVGHGLFGGLACFRDVKQDYLAVSGKEGIFAIWERQTELVQETFVCDEHSPRIPGTGYRG